MKKIEQTMEPIMSVEEWLQKAGLSLNGDYDRFVNVYEDLLESQNSEMPNVHGQRDYNEYLRNRFQLAGKLLCNRRGFLAGLMEAFPIPSLDEIDNMKAIVPEFTEMITKIHMINTKDKIELDQNSSEDLDKLAIELMQEMRLKIQARNLSLAMNPTRTKTPIAPLLLKDKKYELSKYLLHGTVENAEEFMIKKIIKKFEKVKAKKSLKELNQIIQDILDLDFISNYALRNQFKNDNTRRYALPNCISNDDFFIQFGVIDEHGYNPGSSFHFTVGDQTVKGGFTYYRKK